MNNLHKSKVLYQITLALDPRPLNVEKHIIWKNHNDEERILMEFPIFKGPQSHIQCLAYYNKHGWNFKTNLVK